MGLNYVPVSPEQVVLKGCSGLIGSTVGEGFTMRNLNVTAFADMATATVFAPLVHLSKVLIFCILFSNSP